MDDALAEIRRIRARLAELEALAAKPTDMNQLIRARAGRGIAAPTPTDEPAGDGQPLDMNARLRQAAGLPPKENTDDAA